MNLEHLRLPLPAENGTHQLQAFMDEFFAALARARAGVKHTERLVLSIGGLQAAAFTHLGHGLMAVGGTLSDGTEAALLCHYSQLTVTAFVEHADEIPAKPEIGLHTLFVPRTP
jgi:hypothetical protein